MTINVPIKEFKNRVSELTRLFEDGERIVVTRNGKPVFELAAPRKGGIDLDALDRWKEARGLPQSVVGPLPSDFDDPLPEDFLITPLRLSQEAA